MLIDKFLKRLLNLSDMVSQNSCVGHNFLAATDINLANIFTFLSLD